jgi:hypothetical protein
MGAFTYAKTDSCELPNGNRLVTGTAAGPEVYITGGGVLDVSADFSGSPKVFINGDDGYVIQHDRGTAAAGELLVYMTNSAANGAMLELTNAANLANVLCPILIIGKPA